MEIKLFEVRDRMTFIPVICVRCNPANEAEKFLIADSDYGMREERQAEWILMGRLRDRILRLSPSDQDGYPKVRAMWMAHHHILKHWDELQTGDVIDIEFILNETSAPKISQRLGL